MPTIVTYSDTHPPVDHFPDCISSPTHASPCCTANMDTLGHLGREDRFEYTYRRCRTCGFTVRGIVRYLPDERRLADLRRLLATTLTKGMPPA